MLGRCGNAWTMLPKHNRQLLTYIFKDFIFPSLEIIIEVYYLVLIDPSQTAFLENVLGFVRVIETVLDFIKNLLPEFLGLTRCETAQFSVRYLLTTKPVKQGTKWHG